MSIEISGTVSQVFDVEKDVYRKNTRYPKIKEQATISTRGRDRLETKLSSDANIYITNWYKHMFLVEQSGGACTVIRLMKQGSAHGAGVHLRSEPRHLSRSTDKRLEVHGASHLCQTGWMLLVSESKRLTG